MITQSKLDGLIRAREIWLRVSGGLRSWTTNVTKAYEEASWLYLAGAPILNDSGGDWSCDAPLVELMLRGSSGPETVDYVHLDEVKVPAGRALLVAVGFEIRLRADTASSRVVDFACDWAMTSGPCKHGCPVPLQYPCPRQSEDAHV